jgi:hypothetical protein
VTQTLLALALLTAPAPSLDEVIAYHARNAANRRERQEARSLTNAARTPSQRVQPPGGTQTLQIPVTGQGRAPDGRLYTFSGVVTLTIEDTTPPPPLTTRLSSVTDALTGAPTPQAVSGQNLRLNGDLLYTSGSARLVWSGRILPVSRWSAGEVLFQAPAVTARQTAPLILYWLVGNGWQEKGRLTLTVTPEGAPPPPPPGETVPTVDHFENEAGQTIQQVFAGDRLVIVGTGFGTVKGAVNLPGNMPAVVETWTDTRIAVRVGPAGSPQLAVQVQKPGEAWVTQWPGVWVLRR